ncbi:hypothetical protein GC177_07725 [bacterium]|nr:hypothetical protein [bacterium]
MPDFIEIVDDATLADAAFAQDIEAVLTALEGSDAGQAFLAQVQSGIAEKGFASIRMHTSLSPAGGGGAQVGFSEDEHGNRVADIYLDRELLANIRYYAEENPEWMEGLWQSGQGYDGTGMPLSSLATDYRPMTLANAVVHELAHMVTIDASLSNLIQAYSYNEAAFSPLDSFGAYVEALRAAQPNLPEFLRDDLPRIHLEGPTGTQVNATIVEMLENPSILTDAGLPTLDELSQDPMHHISMYRTVLPAMNFVSDLMIRHNEELTIGVEAQVVHDVFGLDNGREHYDDACHTAGDVTLPTGLEGVRLVEEPTATPETYVTGGNAPGSIAITIQRLPAEECTVFDASHLTRDTAAYYYRQQLAEEAASPSR